MNEATGDATGVETGDEAVVSLNVGVAVGIVASTDVEGVLMGEGVAVAGGLVGSDPGTGTTERDTVAPHCSRVLPSGQQPALVQ